MKTINVTLFDRAAIRDVLSHDPPHFLDLSKAKAWGFEVRNSCNQPVIVALIGGPGGGLTGAGGVVAAGVTEPVITDVWLPRLGLRATYAVAPVAGSLSITGWLQEE